MSKLADRLIDEAIEGDFDLLRVEAGLRSMTSRQLSRLATVLTTRIAEYPPRSLSGRNLKRLLKAANTTIDNHFAAIQREMRKSLRGIVEVAEAQEVIAINTAIGANIVAPVISPNEIKRIADMTMIEGAPSRTWWKRQALKTKNLFADAMRRSIVRGDTLGEMLRIVRGRRENNFRDGIMAIPTRNAEAIIRTSVQAVANKTREDTLRAHSDIVKGVQAIVTLDNRTSHICMARSCFAWDLNGKPLPKTPTNMSYPGPPPWHWNCRTTLIPVLKSWSELTNGKVKAKVPPGTRASMDGQVAGDLCFEDWLKTKDETFQRKLLGPGRYDLWKKGHIKLTDLVDQRGRSLTIAELKEKIRIKSMLPIDPDNFTKGTMVDDQSMSRTDSNPAVKRGQKWLRESYGDDYDKMMDAMFDARDAAMDMEEAMSDMNKLAGARRDAKYRLFRAAQTKYNKAREDVRKWMKQLRDDLSGFYGQSPEVDAYVRGIQINMPPGERDTTIRQWLQEYAEMVNADSQEALPLGSITYDLDPNIAEGFYRPSFLGNEAEIHIVPSGASDRLSSKSTLWHELTHGWQAGHPDIIREERAFIAQRYGFDSYDEVLEYVKHIGEIQAEDGSLPFDEQEEWIDFQTTASESFYNVYAGKVYLDGTTEISTMGMQMFSDANSMAELYIADPAHFEFLLGQF